MKIRLLFIILLVGISLFLRLYRVTDFTEFLGDQGSAGIVIYDHFKAGTLPLVGPEASTGQRPGPFYYYLIALPFILSGFNPVVPAIWMGFIGVGSVLLLLYLSTKLFGFWIGYSVAFLYAVSSQIVSSSRNLWNPTPIPFLILLALVGLIKIYKEQHYWYSLLVGFAVGAMIQLHYTTFFVLGVVSLAFFYSLLRMQGKHVWRKRLLGMLLYIGAFLLVLAPFLYYESLHGFVDLREVILLFVYPEAKSPVTTDVVGLATNVFSRVIPLGNSAWFWLIPIVLSLPALISGNFWYMFFSLWFWLGIGIFKFYHGSVHAHYLYFLAPIPFLIFGYFLAFLSRFISKKILVGIVVILVLLHLQHADIGKPGVHDIERTDALTREMETSASGKPFSFTVIKSRSFSDLHYRYFFHIRGIPVTPVTSDTYKTLFIVCERDVCPTAAEISGEDHVIALCWDFVCDREYPWVGLRKWKLMNTKDIEGARLFTWERI